MGMSRIHKRPTSIFPSTTITTMQSLEVLFSGFFIVVSAVLTHWFDDRRVKHQFAEQRSESLRDLKLNTFSRMNKEVEIASGRLGAVAVSINGPEVEDIRNLLHEAWYATRDFEMLFPQLCRETDELRNLLLEQEAIVKRQISNKQFDPEELRHVKSVRIVLDEIAANIRAELGLGD